MVMNFKQTKIKFKPQIKLNHYISSVNSTCTQHIPPGVTGGGAFDRLVSPGVGHLQILHCQRPGHLPTQHAASYQNITNQRVLLEKKQIGSSVKERNKLKRVVKACS